MLQQRDYSCKMKLLGFSTGDRLPIGVIKPYSIVIMQFWQLVCASLLFLSVASCKKEPTIAPSTAPSMAPPKASTAPPTAPPKASTDLVEIEVPAPKSGTIVAAEKSMSLNDLQIKIGSTKKAIVTGKLAEAKTEFAAIETAWKTIESGVMSKSPDRYKAIESGIKSVSSDLASNRDKNILLASLEKLSQNIDIARK
jgi:hypothetical protein